MQHLIVARLGRSLVSVVLIGAGLICARSTAAAAPPASYSNLQPDQFLKTWLVLAPIPVAAEKTPDEARQKQAFAEDLLASVGGESGVQPEAGAKVIIAGKTFEWRVVSSHADAVDLMIGKTPEEFSIAYAWAGIEMPQATGGLLGIGSDDGVKVWLNGRQVHENWIGRGTQPDDDVVPVQWEKGNNRLLLKVQNMEGPWGFVCRWMGPESQARKLGAAARNGDVEAAKLLLDRGVDLHSRSAIGLTAVQTARLHGQREMIEFLSARGADAKAELPPPEKLVDALFTSLFKGDGPGAAVLVAQNGSVLLERGYGLANIGHRVAVTPETRFRIGSISKQFTAAAILKLQEEGKLSIDDKLSKFIADYPRGDEVTVHHLLTHTSGIHSYTGKPDFLDTVTVGVEPEPHIKSFKNDPYDFDPGKQWSYNNSGYFLLGYIIEKVSGQSYDKYLRQTFFEPLGMRDTGVHEATAILDHEATGYSYENGRLSKALDWNMSRAGGAGALYSTVRDLYRWNEAVFNGKVLSEASLKAAFTPVKTAADDAAEPKEAGYGYGWGIQKLRGLREIAHGGGLHGFVTFLLRLPQEHFTVAVLVNCAPPRPGTDPGGLAHDIAEFYLADVLAPREIPKVDASVTPESLDVVVGRYDYGTGVLTVTREGGKLFAQLTGQPRFPIYPKSDTEFFWKVTEAEVKFVKNENGDVIKAIHKQGGQTLQAPKLEDVKEARVDSKLFETYVGRYDYGGGKAIMTISREGDRLFAQLTGQPKFEIFPRSETEFFWKAVPAQVTFVKADDGKVTKVIHEQGGRKFEAPRIE